MITDVQQAGYRLKAFLDDPAVKEVLAAYKDGAYRAFLSAKTDDERRNAHAEAVALDKLVGVLEGIVEEGALKDQENAQ